MGYGDGTTREGFVVDDLFKIIGDATKAVKTKMAKLKEAGENISIGEMFEMQMLMNCLSQLSEMATGVVAASHNAINAMARGVKG
jgi:Family of unknown function (DUF5407)